MGSLFGGDIGKLLAPLPKSIDPVGNATNKALGLDEKEAEEASTPQQGKPMYEVPLSYEQEIEKKRKAASTLLTEGSPIKL